MSGRAPAWAATGVLVVVVAAVVAHVVLSRPDGATVGPDRVLALGWLIELGPVAFGAMGALLVLRRPRHPIGWLLSAYGVLLAAGWLSEAYALRSLARHHLPASAVAGWLANWGWATGVLVLGWALLLFPTGRLPSPRWRSLVWLGAATLVGWLAVAWLLWPYRSPVLATSAYLGGGQPGPASAVAGPLGIAVAAVFVGCAASVVLRFRGSRGDERQQIKWLLFAGGFMTAGIAVVVLGGGAPGQDAPAVGDGLLGAGILGIPAAVAVAVLRYRLYEIDRLISRTVSYALLTGLLAGIYLGAVLVLQSLLAPVAGGSDLAVAGGTLAVAAAFGPARRRIQESVDRRFHRARYDAARTVAGFRTQLRGAVDLDELTGGLVAAVSETVQPATAALWLRGPPADRPHEHAGRGRDGT